VKILEARDLSLTLFGGGCPIFQKSLELKVGEWVALVGPSGSGKTLFLRSICLLEAEMTGKIFWRGKRVFEDEILTYRSSVMYSGQRSALPLGTVEEAFQEFFRFRAHRGKLWDRERTLRALKSFGKPDDFLSRRSEQLSGGEKQLVDLLRTVALDPEVLCLDEPTSALDARTVRSVEDWLSGEFQGAWIWVTHQEDQVPRVSQRQIQMQ
jgi:putative ABC transport system ATP-binding protein